MKIDFETKFDVDAILFPIKIGQYDSVVPFSNDAENRYEWVVDEEFTVHRFEFSTFIMCIEKEDTASYNRRRYREDSLFATKEEAQAECKQRNKKIKAIYSSLDIARKRVREMNVYEN